MEGIGLPHALIMIVILLVFFGPSRLPALGQSIGKAIKGFKDGMNEVHNEMDKPLSPPTAQAPVDQNVQQLANLNQENVILKKEDKSHQNNS